MNPNDAAALAHMATFGTTPTNDDLLSYKRGRCLKAALDAITRLMLDKKDAETSLADIPTADGGTVADLPSIVATAISKPWGSLGLDTSPEWGATTSDWYRFQHQAEDFMRMKIDRARMRKLHTAAQRLYLALGSLQWAGVLGVRDVPGFQTHFTTALIFDRDATAELNGETIDVAPLETDTPLTNALLMQIVESLEKQGIKIDTIAQAVPSIVKDAHNAAAKTIDQLNGKSRGGKKGGASRKEETKSDPVRTSITRWVTDRMREWDEEHPERKAKGYKGYYTNGQIFRYAQDRQINCDANGERIFTATQIKEWFKPSKIRRRGGRVKR